MSMAKTICANDEISLIFLPMAAQCFHNLLSDDDMRVQLARGEAFFFQLGKGHVIERQIDRLGFEDV